MPHNSQTKKDKHNNQAKEIERLEARVKRLEQDLADTLDYHPFMRCVKCKRLRPAGYICPNCGED